MSGRLIFAVLKASARTLLDRRPFHKVEIQDLPRGKRMHRTRTAISLRPRTFDDSTDNLLILIVNRIHFELYDLAIRHVQRNDVIDELLDVLNRHMEIISTLAL